MKRFAPMRRRANLKPRKPIPAKNGKRRAKAFARAYGSKERVALIQSLPCVICAQTPSENAHIETGGMGRKADASLIVPLCAREHRRLHAWGRQTFERFHGVDLELYAAETDALVRRLGVA